MANFSSQSQQQASKRLRLLLMNKKQELNLGSNSEYAELLQKYIDTDAQINSNTVQSWTDSRRPSFPDIQKLKAIATFLGYTLDEFYSYLFDIPEASESPKEDKMAEIMNLIFNMSISQVIVVHRHLSEQIYREAVIAKVN